MVTDNRAEVRRVLVITLLLNLWVILIKSVLGWITGSLSLLADALHSVTDAANNLLGLAANHFASPYPDREHPYGHQKFDALGALGVAAFLGVACFEIISTAIERIVKGFEPVAISGSQLWILLIVLGVNIFVAYYERRAGIKLGSALLVADAKHTMSDIWTTLIVASGLVGIWIGKTANLPQLQILDVVLAFPVAFFVFRSGWEVIQENLPWLVDQMAIAPETIEKIAMAVPGVINCSHIASRGQVGRQVFIEMNMVVAAMDVATAHAITEAVEAELEKRFSPVRVVIHLEPPEYISDDLTYEQPSDL
ncbi:MAG: cation transporter [Oscillatoriales cyanobacterium RM2_1_1]|nr:cation transporter [Oscillatoriales cyanobacterium RM2_1_1]